MRQRLSVSIDEEIVSRMDKERGLMPRSIVVNEMLKTAYAVKDGQAGVS